MTIWLPNLADRKGPRYQAIADALADDIAAGTLTPGTRLPTHRDLAWRLGVTIGTVSRAYAEAERRGLIGGEVGRGTFVRNPAEAARRRGTGRAESQHYRYAGPIGPMEQIDLARNYMPLGPAPAMLAETLREISAEGDATALMSYHLPAGWIGHSMAGVKWLAASGIEATPERLVVTCGGHHGVSLSLSALARPGDVIAAESLTYTGLMAVCRQHGMTIEPIAHDDEGILPDAFEATCRRMAIRFLYLVPNLQNPLGGILSTPRREAIVATARRHDVLIIEDDIFGFLIEAPPAFVTLAPERTLHVASLSKSLAPGLRIGWLLTPPALTQRIADAIHADVWMAAPLMAEIASRWIADGRAAALAQWKRDQAPRHQEFARRILGNSYAPSHPHAYHFWLPLPVERRAADVVAEAQRRGVAVLSGDAFAAAPGYPIANGIRICLGATADLATLEQGLSILAGVLKDQPATPRLLVV
ncbi:MAG TPA: PLP-dependent aminotransferase family protein [Stellaceae bacterium]|nr:PLP-dependent aminotransferase family protein [Stellaceae bacterium]